MATPSSDHDASLISRRASLRRTAVDVVFVLAVLVIVGEVAALVIQSNPFVDIWDSDDPASGIYWLSSSSFATTTILRWAFVPAIMWLCALSVYRGREKLPIRRLIIASTAIGIGCLACFVTMTGSEYEPKTHAGSVWVEGHVYHLANREGSFSNIIMCLMNPPGRKGNCRPGEIHQGVLFECDTLGFNCRMVYESEYRTNGWVTDVRLNPEGVIEILDSDGEVVGRYTPP